MTCKRSEQCDHADLCRFAKNTDYNLLGGSCFEPKDPQTNEEWLKHCTTEQLAEWISDITCNCWGCKRIYVEDCPNYARYKACFCDKEDVVDWLKATTH